MNVLESEIPIVWEWHSEQLGLRAVQVNVPSKIWEDQSG